MFCESVSIANGKKIATLKSHKFLHAKLLRCMWAEFAKDCMFTLLVRWF